MSATPALRHFLNGRTRAAVALLAAALLCVTVAASLSACREPLPTPTLTSTPPSEPTATPTPIPTPTATATATPTATLTPTASPTPTPTSTPTAAPTAAPSATPTNTPTPRPTSTPTAEEAAVAHLSTIVPWFRTPPDEYHYAARTWITSLWQFNSELGEAVARLPWVNDGIDAESALSVSGASHTEYDVLRSMGSVARKDQGLAERLLRIWTNGGPDPAETAFITLLRDMLPDPDVGYPGQYQRLYNDLSRSYDLQSATIALPLAGDVHIWVFQNTPFAESDDFTTPIADTVRIMEEILGVPFPVSNVKLLIVDSRETDYGVGGIHLESHMRLARYGQEVASIPHETAHYYFAYMPEWLSEGGADLMESYVRDRTGVEKLSERRLDVAASVRHCNEGDGIGNILHMHYHSGYFGKGCAYPMGENLLYHVGDLIGQEALSAALGELVALNLEDENALWYSWNRDTQPAEEGLIFNVFSKHTPPELQARLRETYRRLHGSSAGSNRADDHGSSAATATSISVGQTVRGALDREFDVDYFGFKAEPGRRYRIQVNHRTLGPTNLWLQSAYQPVLRRGEEHIVWERQLTDSGPQILWTAPTSDSPYFSTVGEYYVSVEDYSGNTGPYTLTITLEG